MSKDLTHPDHFLQRHLGPSEGQTREMLKTLGAASLDALVEETVPAAIRLKRPLNLPEPVGEADVLKELRAVAAQNRVFRSYIGMGYSDCITPAVIQRNILENPGWYTQYTPYQAEIAQGRLEALLNFQTMVMDLTGLDMANASLLDEGTAAAEAMHMAWVIKHKEGEPAVFLVSHACHPQTVDVVRTRAEPLGIEVVVGDHQTFDFKKRVFGALVSYPNTDGAILDYADFTRKVQAQDGLMVVVSDLLALTILTPPGEWGADIVVGNTQRFGVPMGYGGPHAAFFATKATYARSMPGRIIGVSEDAQGRPALRMALQTREQHIRREKATSNICTSQVLLAIMASMYAVYHGPARLKAMAERVHKLTRLLALGLESQGYKIKHAHYFDTLVVDGTSDQVKGAVAAGLKAQMNFRRRGPTSLGISLDETTSLADVRDILEAFSGGKKSGFDVDQQAQKVSGQWPAAFVRKSAYLQHPVFNRHHGEAAMQRYIRTLESRDLSLTHSMIALGSCTMKLNAATEMMSITWPEFCKLHPFAPAEQATGYAVIFKQLESMLREVTGFAGISLQPNAGSQGEYAGLLVIRAYQKGRGQGHRDVCLIPQSAHGTNPASAVLAGFKVVVVKCDENGNIDVGDLKAKAQEHAANLAALMVTYPSTHGVFEESIREICEVVHKHGGQVYMDGANMNAQVGLTSPAEIGADVCHLNLHKTFCIPHGGGGPGMGPIGVASHLVPFLPGHAVVKTGGEKAMGAVSAAPYGSANILLISWSYIRMMGAAGLTEATKVAILNANYVAHRLGPQFPVLYKGKQGRVAHECILDMRHLKRSANIEVEDIAKRLMDYGFHAPTVSFPVAGTMMVEPTESEPKEELDRFCDAMLAIRAEIAEVESGAQPQEGNVLKHAPHTSDAVSADAWTRPYSRQKAAFPLPFVRAHKFWPYVGRINNPLGDRKLICACPPVEDYA